MRAIIFHGNSFIAAFGVQRSSFGSGGHVLIPQSIRDYDFRTVLGRGVRHTIINPFNTRALSFNAE